MIPLVVLMPSVVINTAPTEIYTLSLHDALPIWRPSARAPLQHRRRRRAERAARAMPRRASPRRREDPVPARRRRDRKSTRLNSSHTVISYAVFCLKKKKTEKSNLQSTNKLTNYG